MANTTSNCYQSVGAHWQPVGGPLPPLATSLPVVLLQQQPSALQAFALLALVWSLTTALPKPQGSRQHFKTSVLRWLSGTDLLLCMVGCIVSLGTNGINVASITNNFPMLSGSLLWQAFQLTRLTMMAWFIKKLDGSPNKSSCHHQEKRKISTTQRKTSTTQRKISTRTQSKSQAVTEFVVDFISKSLDKFIIFAVLLASVILFFCSILYLAVKPMLSWIHKSHLYKNVLNLVKQLTSQLTVSLGKHPLNRKLMVLVPTSLVISACVSSVQVLDYV